MLTFIFILIIILAILLIGVVLIQNPKGGIAANFVAPSQIMGVKRSTDVIEKATWVFAIALISLTLLSNFFRPSSEATDASNDSRIKDKTEEMAVPTAPQQTPPAQGQQQQQNNGAQPANDGTQPAAGQPAK